MSAQIDRRLTDTDFGEMCAADLRHVVRCLARRGGPPEELGRIWMALVGVRYQTSWHGRSDGQDFVKLSFMPWRISVTETIATTNFHDLPAGVEARLQGELLEAALGRVEYFKRMNATWKPTRSQLEVLWLCQRVDMMITTSSNGYYDKVGMGYVDGRSVKSLRSRGVVVAQGTVRSFLVTAYGQRVIRQLKLSKRIAARGEHLVVESMLRR